MRRQFPIATMCRALEVSESGYHAWHVRPPSPRAQENARFAVEIKAAHERSRQTYGPERLQAELADHGVKVGVHRIKRLRKELGLACRQKRRLEATTNCRHRLPVAPNLLDRQFAVAAPNRVRVADITCLATDERWLYLAGLKDLFDGELVGYALGERMTLDLVMKALFRAVAARRPGKGSLHRSDRGGQYCAREYRRLLRRFDMQISMSRKADCWDTHRWKASGVR